MYMPYVFEPTSWAIPIPRMRDTIRSCVLLTISRNTGKTALHLLSPRTHGLSQANATCNTSLHAEGHRNPPKCPHRSPKTAITLVMQGPTHLLRAMALLPKFKHAQAFRLSLLPLPR